MIRESWERREVGSYLLLFCSCLVFLFLVVPVIVIVVLSFDMSQMGESSPRQWGIEWYRRFLESSEWRQSLLISLEVALIATILSISTGFLAGLSLVRGKYRGKLLIYAIVLTPMIVPTIITATALYVAFSRINNGGVLAIAIGHAVLALPIVTLLLSSNLRSLDEGAENAALSLGAGRLYTLYKVTLPLAKVPLISAALFAFLTSFDELVIALFLSGARTQTLSVRIWSTLVYSFDPTVTAVSALFITLTTIALIANALARWG